MRDDDNLNDDDYHNRFHSPEVAYNLLRPPLFLGSEQGRSMVARVFARIPHYPQVAIMACTSVVLPDYPHGTYLPAKVVAGRNVVALDAGLLGLAEEEQVTAILPLLAACFQKARHEWEPTVSGNEVDELFDEYEVTGKFREADFDQAMAEVRGERADIRVEARMGMSQAHKLAQEWLVQWNARSSDAYHSSTPGKRRIMSESQSDWVSRMLLPADFRATVRQTLARLPEADKAKLERTGLFVMPRRTQHLTPRFVDGRYVQVFPEALLVEPEEKQARAILEAAARCVVEAKRPTEHEVEDWFDKDTGAGNFDQGIVNALVDSWLANA